LITAVGFIAAACGGSSGGSTGGATQKGSITVGAANFAESTLLANMFAEVLKKAGYTASVKQLTTREVYEPALEKGDDIQAFPEYAATLTEFLNKKDKGPNAPAVASTDIAETLTTLTGLAGAHNLVVGKASAATDQNAYATTQAFATTNNLTKLSDLAGYTGKLVLGAGSECPPRPFCKKGLEDKYGIKFTGFKTLDSGGPLVKAALKNGSVQLGLVFSSDPGIETFKLKVLEDDKHLQASDNLVPVLNKKVAQTEAINALNGLMAVLTQDDLVSLNKQVQIDHQPAASVARGYLQAKGLI
jgi:osmoprotectant transport system substrate-binding protein